MKAVGTKDLKAFTIAFTENMVELLATEFEHVLEQVDRVDLRSDAANGRARALPDGAFETDRATEAGHQVLREYREYEEALAPEPARRRHLGLR